MAVTRKQVANSFGIANSQVKQINSMQLFIINNDTLVSYKTIVGRLIAGVWHITSHRYSVTTTKQVNRFKRMYTNHIISGI